jgi:hypothetical protein
MTRSPLILLMLSTPAWADQLAPATDEAPAEPVDLDGDGIPDEVIEEITHNIRVVRFDSDLYVGSDIMLQGMGSTHYQGFPSPGSWELIEDPEVRIHFEHSAALLNGRSSLTISINDESIASVMLDDENTVDGELIAKIPRRLLSDYNQLGLAVVQHVNEECEDPFDPALWTRVGLNSSIVFAYEDKPVEGELLDFPYPFFDAQGYGPMKLALGGGQTTSNSQLEVLGDIGLALGRLAAYRQVEMQPPVRDPMDAMTHLLVVGTPDQNPLVNFFVDSTTLVAGEGLVGAFPNPDHPELAVLVVTGGDDAGMKLAADAVSSQDRYQLLSGESATVTDLVDAMPPPSKRDPLPVPETSEFTLADLGIQDRTIRGFYAAPLRIPLKMGGDSRVRIDGARLFINYGYAAHLDTRLSSLEVRLNGVTLRSVPLNDEEGEQMAELEVELPHELMEPTSEIEVVFHLFPDEFAPCSYIGDRHIWGTIFESSRFELDRDHYAMVPDLSLLRHDLWPLAAGADDGSLVVVTSDKPDLTEVTAAFQFVADIGRVSTSDSADINLLASYAGLLEEHSESHVVVLKGDDSHSTFKSLRSGKHITAIPGLLSQLSRADQKLFAAEVGTPYGSIEQTLHPNNDQRTIMVFQGPDDNSLLSTLGLLRDPSRLLRLSGNAAVISEAGHVRSLDIADQVQIGTIPLLSRIQTFLRSSWPILGLGVVLAAILLTALVRKWAARRGGQA